MRPPRSISGSSSAAAAAAVATAMATVANARLPNASFVHGYEGFSDSGRLASSRSAYVMDERTRLSTRAEEYHQQLGHFHPLMRRSSASSAQPLDDGSDSSEQPRHRRKLHSYYSSPSSLRNLFVSGGGVGSSGGANGGGANGNGNNNGGGPVRSSAPFSASYRHPETPPAINRYAYGARESLSAEAKTPGGYDYFNLPLSHSAGSTPSVSSPSCNVLSRGMAQLNPFEDSRLASATTPALSSPSLSLPPTPTHPMIDRSNEGVTSPTHPFDPVSTPFRPQSFQGSHRLVGHVLKNMPRRTSSSPYLVSQYQSIDAVQTYHFPDRRSSLPWDAHIASSSSQPPCETRALATSQQRIDMVAQAQMQAQGSSGPPTMSALNNNATLTKNDDQNMTIPPQGYLLRSNSTPAIFGSLPRFMGYPVHDKQGSESLLEAEDHAENMDTSTCSKLVHGFSTSALAECRSQRPGHPLDVYDDGKERPLPLITPSPSQYWSSNQCTQQGNLQRGGGPLDIDQLSDTTQRQLADVTRGASSNNGNANNGGTHEYSGNLQGPISRQLKGPTSGPVYDANMILTQEISGPFYMDTSRSQDPERTRNGSKEQEPSNYELSQNRIPHQGQTSFMNVDRSWGSKDPQYSSSQTMIQEERAPQIQPPTALPATPTASSSCGNSNHSGFASDGTSGTKSLNVHSQLRRPTVETVTGIQGASSSKENIQYQQHSQQQHHHQSMKVEAMDGENLESSLAMVLDGRLTLMDLQMNPEVEVYSGVLPLASMASFKHHVPSLPTDFRAVNPPQKPTISDHHHHSPLTLHEMDGGSVSMAPSTIFAVINGSAVNNPDCNGGNSGNGGHISTCTSSNSGNISHGNSDGNGGSSISTNSGNNNSSSSNSKQEMNSGSIPYFSTSEGDYPGGGGGNGGSHLQIKIEPDLKQQTLSNPLHYTLERQHPFDTLPMQQISYQPHQQQHLPHYHLHHHQPHYHHHQQ